MKRARKDTAPEALIVVEGLLAQKAAVLVILRRHIQIRSQLEIWLKIHVPATVALLMALAAHVYSVFFYW
jgi:hypothetical protein